MPGFVKLFNPLNIKKDIIAKWLMRGTVNAFLEGSNPSNIFNI
jgi:hypothetical protein